MRVQVKRWGNSASVRIPARVMEAASLRLEQALDIRVEDGCVILEPACTPVADLAAMLARLTPETFHDDVDFGAPVGRELW